MLYITLHMKLFKFLLFSVGALLLSTGLFADQHDKCSCEHCKCDQQNETCSCDKNCDHCKAHSE